MVHFLKLLVQQSNLLRDQHPQLLSFNIKIRNKLGWVSSTPVGSVSSNTIGSVLGPMFNNCLCLSRRLYYTKTRLFNHFWSIQFLLFVWIHSKIDQLHSHLEALQVWMKSLTVNFCNWRHSLPNNSHHCVAKSKTKVSSLFNTLDGKFELWVKKQVFTVWIFNNWTLKRNWNCLSSWSTSLAIFAKFWSNVLVALVKVPSRRCISN